jgi:hypothetical protein
MIPMCVFLMKRNGQPYRWIVKITVRGERKYIGCFQTKDQATKALELALKKYKH